MGEYAVVLGEAEDHVMTAGKIYMFASAPALAAGLVTAADAAARTLTVDAQGNEQNGQERPTTLTAATPRSRSTPTSAMRS